MTPTPTIKSITLSDGTRLEDRGEVRTPKEGEYFLGEDRRAVDLAMADFKRHKYPILSPVEAPAGGIERRGDWPLDCPELGDERHITNALIDAACAVVNSVPYTGPVAESVLAELAAALRATTESEVGQ